MKIIICQDCAHQASKHGKKVDKVFAPHRCEVCEAHRESGELYIFETTSHPVWWKEEK